jgi:dienelactone hydrolase
LNTKNRSLLAVGLALVLTGAAEGRPPLEPETVSIPSGGLNLRAQLWRPAGSGPFPAVLFNHGSYSSKVPMGPNEAPALGQVFARHGYLFLFLHRQGIGLSAGKGTADGDLMDRAFTAEGQEGRNRVQLQLLENDEMNEALAALAFLRSLPEVDAQRIAVAGHSFGGSLTLLLAARDSTPRAAVVYAGAAYSWERSPALRERLLAAAGKINCPVLLMHAANDYSTASGKALAEEMQRLGKPHELKMYPPVGKTAREGHNFLFRSTPTWEGDVFAFLDRYVKQGASAQTHP